MKRTPRSASRRASRQLLANVLMCDDVEAFVAEMTRHGIATDAVRDEGWGVLTQLTLPSGAKLGVYQPRHARPAPMNV